MEPVTPLAVATTTIGGNVVGDTFMPIASTTPKLAVDIDGNGSVDYVARTGGTGWPENATSTDSADKIAQRLSLEALGITVRALTASSTRRTSILHKIDRLKELFKQGRVKENADDSEKPSKNVGHKRLKNISAKDAQDILDNIEGDVDDALRL